MAGLDREGYWYVESYSRGQKVARGRDIPGTSETWLCTCLCVFGVGRGGRLLLKCKEVWIVARRIRDT